MTKQRSPLKVLLVGGGSGGHVTPLKAIAQSLLTKQKDISLEVVTDGKFFEQTKIIFQDLEDIKLHRVLSGKYRRYHGKSIIWHLTHIPTAARNLRDVVLIGLGFIQSWWLLMRSKPDVVFSKGGYVSVPVGLAARTLHIPLVIHDSDTHPGLTSRLLAPSAKVIATGMPADYYRYPAHKMIYTGIPVDKVFKPVSAIKQAENKAKLGFDKSRPLLLVVGGGTGSVALNNLVVNNATGLIDEGWQIAHITGAKKASDVLLKYSQLPLELRSSWQIHEFVALAPYILAADLVLTRTGASAMQEFANAKKPVITIPSPHLTGGHQIKNAQMFAEAGSAMVLNEKGATHESGYFLQHFKKLSRDSKSRQNLATKLNKNFAKPEAADQLAEVVIEAAAGKTTSS